MALTLLEWPSKGVREDKDKEKLSQYFKRVIDSIVVLSESLSATTSSDSEVLKEIREEKYQEQTNLV